MEGKSSAAATTGGEITFSSTLSIPSFLRVAIKERLLTKQIIDFGENYLQNHSQTEESWQVREQLIKSLLDDGNIEKASQLLNELKIRFGLKSQRVNLLEGLIFESKGEFDKAEQVYDDLIKKNWNNTLAGKRLACTKRSKGDLNGAVKQLNSLLMDNQSDPEVFAELCDLQLTVGAYEAAAFCAEELLLVNPHSYIANCFYAEILYTCSRGNAPEQITDKWAEDSRTYFSQSLVLKKENNPRAAWGLMFAVRAKKTPAKDEVETNISLSKKTAKLLESYYEKSPMKDLVQPVLKQLLL
jgi:tetratricopeptide (TPR) repeat protein